MNIAKESYIRMKIKNVNNPVSFGLKIIKNRNYETIVNYRKEHGESEKEIADSFARVSKLYDDNLSLEFCNSKQEDFEIFGISAIFSNIKLKGLMRASDSNKQYEIDILSQNRCVSDDEMLLTQEIKNLLRQEQKRIDTEDWAQ